MNNILHLRYALEIAKTHSISKAAENLYMGQPNLSRAIKELEDSIGAVIFERSAKGIIVTEDGEKFLQYARRILSQVDEMESVFRDAKHKKQKFSVSVPRASYISKGFTEFAKHIDPELPAEITYRETNSMRTVTNVLQDEYNLGIVRYQRAFEPQYSAMFEEKGIVSQTITEFTYLLAVSVNSPLAGLNTVTEADLAGYIEITHPDPYVPSVPVPDIRKAEIAEYTDKRIYIFERASQFDLLGEIPDTFMWVSPLPENICRMHGIVQRRCDVNPKVYKDVLIHKKGYVLSALDNLFITEVCNAKRDIVDAFK